MTEEEPRASDRAVGIEWSVETCGPVALVSVRLDNRTGSAQSIRLTNQLDGPTLAPRRHGVPEAGWDEDGFTGVVPPEDGISLGFACPLPAAPEPRDPLGAASPPVALSVHSTDEVDREPPDASAVIRDRGEARPPADAVPLASGRNKSTSGPGRAAERPNPPVDGGGSSRPGPDRDPHRPDPDDDPHHPGLDGDPGSPTAWLERVEARIERLERLDGASVATATTILRERGGRDRLESDIERVRRYARVLEELTERASALAARADSVDPPMDALERLA